MLVLVVVVRDRSSKDKRYKRERETDKRGKYDERYSIVSSVVRMRGTSETREKRDKR